MANLTNVTTSLANLENVTCSSHRVITRITGHRSQAKLGQNPVSPLSPLHLRHCRAAWIDHQYLQGLIGLKIGAHGTRSNLVSGCACGWVHGTSRNGVSRKMLTLLPHLAIFSTCRAVSWPFDGPLGLSPKTAAQ